MPVTLIMIEKLESIPADTPFRIYADNCSNTHFFNSGVQEKLRSAGISLC